MSEKLHRLVYYSRNLIPGTDEKINSEVRQILETSRHNNGREDITGALVFNRGGFAQVLEGPIEKVSATFERIQRDPRHGDVLVLQFQPTPKRVFSHWSMAFISDATRDDDLFRTIKSESGFDPKSLNGDRIFAAMQRLVIEEENVRYGQQAG